MESEDFRQAQRFFSRSYRGLISQQERARGRLFGGSLASDEAEIEDGAWDRWGLVVDGECRHREFAYFTKCVTDEQRILNQCAASICALLATTDPPCVVAVVSRWVYENAGPTFARNGVVLLIAPEWAPLPERHPYAHLTGSTGNSSFDRLYTFSKFEAARLTQYQKLVAFDADILFMRNASGITRIPSFAASRVPKGKDINHYINNGMMVLQPATNIYNGLVHIWRSGDFRLYYSDEESTEQDVYTELCWTRGLCGPKNDLDACIYNHGSWIPNKFWRECPSDTAVARHNFKGSREVMLTRTLGKAWELGTCRQRASGALASYACFNETPTLSEANVVYTYDFCCNSWESGVGGNPVCWYGAWTYERCCFPVQDAKDLREDILDQGDSWYGLSTVPDHPPEDWLTRICLRQYVRQRFTFAAESPRALEPYPVQDWRIHEAPNDVNRRGFKCEGVDGQLVVFIFDWRSYLSRNANHPAAKAMRIDPWEQNHVVCVPTSCCVKPPSGVTPPRTGLRVVLWHFMLNMASRLPLKVVDALPAPFERDFADIYTVDLEGRNNTDCWGA